MYTPNHKMISIVPPHGTQLIAAVDGTYMFIFDRSLKAKVVDWLFGLTSEAEGTEETSPALVTSSETNTVPKGKVIKGDAIFEFAAPPAKLDETVHVDADVAEAMAEANKRGLHHGDTERPPPTEPNNAAPEV